MSARLATGIGVVMALPFVIIFALLVLNIRPDFGPLEPLLRVGVDEPNVLGSAVVIGALLLAVGGFYMSAGPILRGVRSGSLAATPITWAIAGVILLVALVFLAALIADLAPCIVGSPYCD